MNATDTLDSALAELDALESAGLAAFRGASSSEAIQPARAPRPQSAGELLPARRHDAPEPTQHGAGPGDGEPAAAGARDRDRPGLPARYGRCHPLVHVPPDRRLDGRSRRDDGRPEVG